MTTILIPHRASAGLLLPLPNAAPRIAADAFVAPGAIIIGDVELGPAASIWFNCVVRGDVEAISIGARSNVQDGSIVHADPGFPVRLGEDVLIGHQALLHGCTIEDRAFIGLGAIVMNGGCVASHSMLAAGALLTEGKVIEEGQLWAGRPARFLRDLTPDEIAIMLERARHYVENAKRFRELFAI